MKTPGIIGGIAPESTVDYYRQIIAKYREQNRDEYPQIIINSIDLTGMLAMVAKRDFPALTAHLLREVKRLADAGADFGVFASNTPHIVFDDVASQSAIPLISIVETAADEAQRLRVRKLGLLGTRFTMQGGFYEKVFAKRGIEVVVPDADDQEYVHEKYMSELVAAVFRDETRAGLLRVIDSMRELHSMDGVILGGTELPLLLRDIPQQPIHFLDTTRIHVGAIVDRMTD